MCARVHASVRTYVCFRTQMFKCIHAIFHVRATDVRTDGQTVWCLRMCTHTQAQASMSTYKHGSKKLEDRS